MKCWQQKLDACTEELGTLGLQKSLNRTAELKPTDHITHKQLHIKLQIHVLQIPHTRHTFRILCYYPQG